MAEGLSEQARKELFRNLRAGAESGWDYSTRWFQDKADFGSIRTTEILPVDLNCLMFAVETTLANLYAAKGETQQSDFYTAQADKRKAAIQRVFWDADKGAFTDYIWTENALSAQLTLAGAYPLYFNVASDEQAAAQARVLESDFLLPGGVVTTTIESGQQWDYPNGWAPLQWMSIKGLEHYGETELATEIKNRWLRVNDKVYQNTGKMMEKYNVADTTLTAGGGEYPTQDGFGWSNGVALGLMAEDAAY
ncbi:MAG: trehalase family glycosidase [Marinoscillum sp.]|uniref:trehalase family glycosidase n=1 Tax=Marinoscillum sp. TaxID=2024838 RepID=UPI0032F913D6